MNNTITYPQAVIDAHLAVIDLPGFQEMLAGQTTEQRIGIFGMLQAMSGNIEGAAAIDALLATR